jgi:DNA helicase-2/ATP-dependent DNA helicase PcrA
LEPNKTSDFYDSRVSGDKRKPRCFYITDQFQNGISARIKKMLLQREWQKFNIEELLNGIKDFTEGQKRKLTVIRCLILNLWKMWHWQQIWKDTSDEDRVALMTTTSQRFNSTCFRGMEEDLFLAP